MNWCLTILGLLAMAFGATSCQPAEEGKLAETRALYLNQSLLRESVEGVARIWNTPIELDPEVSAIKDLWVDYSPSREVSLRVALNEILHFVETQHGLALRWSERGDRIIIERQSEQAVDGNPH